MPSTHRKTRGVSLTFSVSNGTTTHQYYYTGDKLTEMTKGSTKLTFTYDAAGAPLTVTYNGTRYYYKTNLQGDVTDILNSSGTAVVSYVYDAYGRIRSKSGSLIDTLGFDNPLRYRGYVYDVQTEFYYLQSRYYYPTWGRFINADAFVSTGQGFVGNNMFAYCGNNPVTRKDTDGYAWETIWDAISLASSVVEVIANPYDPWAWIGLAGDAADVLIPFIGGIGETTRALKTASQAAEVIDTASDAKKGWKVGEDITNLTKAGNTPSWSTVRQRYWKNEAMYNPAKYSDENITLMQKGRAPLAELNGKYYSMELHHITPRRDGGSNAASNLLMLTPWEHAMIDKFRYFQP